MSNKKTIFISYGRDQEHPKDVELVLKIKNDLAKEFNVLMDIDRLKQGNDWENKLSADIIASDWIVFFITPYSARRPDGYCLNELTYGLYKKKSIAPVMLNYEDPPLSICRIQYLDLQKLQDETIYKEKLQEMIAVLKEEKKLGFEGSHVTLLNKLDPLTFNTVIAKHIHGFVGREWIYKRVDKWIKEEVDSRVFWITAEAGYGKTALATYLSERHPSSTSIHYCQHDAQKTKDPINVLKTFIYELSTQVPEYHEKLSGMDIKDKLTGNPADVFDALLVEPLDNIIRPDKDLFFIIDALDEAQDEKGENLIVDLISNRFSNLPVWLNIIITSRPEPEIIWKLKKFNPVALKANEEKNLEDLKLYINQRFKNLEDEKIDVLLQKSEGNMLYLKSVLDSENIKDGYFTLEDIENLPQGMEALYQQFFERKFENSDAYEEDYLDFVSILVASGEGLPLELIKYILKLNERSFRKLKDKFGSLLEENSGVLTFYHKSLFDWLSDYDLSANYSADVEIGYSLIITTLWELYENEEKNNLLYHSYLLRSVYESKQYEKLNTLLQDILFAGQLYDQNEHLFYKKVLLKSIENCSVYDIEKLKIYESFFREKEHLILQKNNEQWKSHQTLFQLAYEDGDDSPLCQYTDEILEKNTIDFSWLRSLKRGIKYKRSGLIKVYDLQKDLWDMSEYKNNMVLFYEDGTAEVLKLTTGIFRDISLSEIQGVSSVLKKSHVDKDLEIVLKYEDFTVKNNETHKKFFLKDIFGETSASGFLLKNREIIYYRDPHMLPEPLLMIYHISLEGKRLKYFSGYCGKVNDMIELSNNRLLSYADDGTLTEWSLDTGGKLSIRRGHLKSVKHAIELTNGNILSYAEDHTLRLWSSRVDEEDKGTDQKVKLICTNGDYICNHENHLYVYDKTDSMIAQQEYMLFASVTVSEIMHNRILSIEESNAEIKIHIWNTADDVGNVCNFYRDESICFIKELENGNFVMKASNPVIDPESDFGVMSEFKVYLYAHTTLFEDKEIMLEKISTNNVFVTQRLFSYTTEDNTLFVHNQEGSCIYTDLLENGDKVKFLNEFYNGMFVLGFDNSKVLLFDQDAHIVRELDPLPKEIKGITIISDNKFVVYAKQEIAIFDTNGQSVASFNCASEIITVERFNNNIFAIVTIENEIVFYDHKANYMNNYYLPVESEIVHTKIMKEKLYVNIGNKVLLYSFENL